MGGEVNERDDDKAREELGTEIAGLVNRIKALGLKIPDSTAEWLDRTGPHDSMGMWPQLRDELLEVLLRAEERCAVCGGLAPSATLDPELGNSPKVAEGWIDFEASEELIIDVPYPEPSTLPIEVTDMIRQFDGLVRIDPDPGTHAAAVREVDSHYAGTVCPDCYGAPERTGWDTHQWLWFLSGPEEARDDPERGEEAP